MTLAVRKSEELRGQAAAKLDEARGIQDAAEQENRRLKPEERDKIDSLLAAMDEDLKDAKREDRMAGIETEITPEERGRRLPESSEDKDEEDEGELDDEEEAAERRALAKTNTPQYVRAFYKAMRQGDDALSMEDRRFLVEARAEIRALTEGVDADGGYLAPTQLLAGVEREALELEQLAPLMNVINTNARSIRGILGVDAVSFSWVGELEQKPEDQPSFGARSIDAHVAAVIIRVSDELLEDSTFGLEAYLSLLAGEAKVEGEEAAFVAGSGAKRPYGILTRLNGEAATPHRFTTAASGVLAGDDFVNALYSLRPKYRRTATWVLGTQAILAARLIKDGNQNYIWQPGLQAGQPNAILGRPIVEALHEDLNNPVAAGNDIGILGDLRRYTVLRRLAMQVKRLEELYAETDEVGFRFRFRTGGDVQNTEAFRSLRIKP